VILPSWTYLLLTVLIVLVPIQKVQLDSATRARVAIIAGFTVLSYVVLVYPDLFRHSQEHPPPHSSNSNARAKIWPNVALKN
jgi:hypothetical protein